MTATAAGLPPLRRYRIDRYLTEGGMGAIYLGRRLGAGGFEKEVVLKQLLPEFTSRPEFRDLFFREAKISASLDHGNIVRTYDLVRADEALFIVMEYVAGTDLRTICWRARLRRKRLSLAAVIHIGMETLAGLAYAHGRTTSEGQPLGIIHRDVSPSNILCSGHGDVKLSDFGIAKASSFASVFYRVRGKVGYMSPEQARNQDIDARSDLFSLAVCLFETLSGERLYVGDLQTPPDEIYGKPLPSLVQKFPDIPIALEGVLRRALTAEPSSRYQDATEFGQALRQVARNAGLLYSAPQLATEIKELLGANPERWQHEDLAPIAVGDTERLPVESKAAPSASADELIGREATPVSGLAPGTLAASPASADGDPGKTPVLPELTPEIAVDGRRTGATSSRRRTTPQPPSGTLETLRLSSLELPSVQPSRSGSARRAGGGSRGWIFWLATALCAAAWAGYAALSGR